MSTIFDPSGNGFNHSEFEKAFKKLLSSIPTDPVDAAGIPEKERKRIWKLVQTGTKKLTELSVELDLISLPPLTYNPANPSNFAESIGNKLLLQQPMPLGELHDRRFYGSGVYAIYYSGEFDAYQPIRDKGTPIYVGKAIPDSRDAQTPHEQGTSLWGRLREHADSISEAENLSLADFKCRYLVVGTGWQDGAEDHLIAFFKPVWNKQMNVCQGIGKHGDDSDTRKNGRSAWDTLHPGRPWTLDAKPNRRTVDEIKARIAEHYAKHPPRL